MQQNTTPHTPHALHVCGDEASMFCAAHISQGLGLSLGRVSCVSSPSGFFSQTFACFRAHAVRGLLCNQLDDLLHSLRILSHILVCVLLFCFGQLRRPSTPCTIIESCQMMTCPGIEPMRDGQTRNLKEVHQFLGSFAIQTEKQTMSTLPDTMILTLFRTSAE